MKATRCILILSALLAADSLSAQQKKAQIRNTATIPAGKAQKETSKPAAGWNMVRQARETTCIKVLQADGSYQQEAWYVYPAAQQ